MDLEETFTRPLEVEADTVGADLEEIKDLMERAVHMAVAEEGEEVTGE